MVLTDEEVRRQDDELADEEWGLEASFREPYDEPLPWEGAEHVDPYDDADHWDEFYRYNSQEDDELLDAEREGNALAA